ncbi:serine/threonine-protein kinase [Thermosynechococcaceae cyanobacterium Okahandja]
MEAETVANSIVTDPRTARSAFEQTGLSSRYELLEEVGRGSMGVVFRGRHRLLDQIVAVKFHTLSNGIDRFRREAQVLAGIHSPHVVSLQDFEILPTGHAMLVMSWIPGSDLGKLLRTTSAPFPEERVLRWMLHVCEGMKAVAEQGIVHRDLKPSNILIDAEDKAYVADFGLARTNYSDPLTLTGEFMGTPHYMAPEQAEDPRTVDTRADIYSYGATFYHILTQHPPFSGNSWFSILLSHKSEPLISPKSRNPLLSERLNDCLERCLAKSPRDRFQSFADIATHLQPSPKTPWDQSEHPEVTRHQKRYRARKPIYLGGRPENLPEPDAYHFMNRRTCTIGFGNLVEQRVDALVSSDDEWLSMGGGVSAQLSRVAGPDYRKMARQYAPVRPGRAVVTPAGSLPARFVLHGITMGQWKDEWVNPSRDLLNEIMESCFYHADTLGLRSIAFPLLGTGAGQFSREVCLDTMFRFLARKLAHGLTTVQEARIVIFVLGIGQWR